VRLEHTGPGCGRILMDDGPFRDVGSELWDPDVRFAHCDRHGVRVQVLSTVPVMFSYWAKPADAHDLARMLNDHLAALVREHPTRFVGLGTLPMQAPTLAVHELERCVNELRLAGVQIGSHVNEWNLEEPRLFPVFEAAAELGAAVFVHPWDMMGRERMPKYWLPWLVGMPAETAMAICSVIFGGVLERLPTLRIGFAHGGGAFPAIVGRMERGFDARPDLVAVDNPVHPRVYRGRFYTDSLVHDADCLRHLIQLVGVDRIALGSDYPFPLGEEAPGCLIESMDDLSTVERERLLAGTALEFLDLRGDAFW